MNGSYTKLVHGSPGPQSTLEQNETAWKVSQNEEKVKKTGKQGKMQRYIRVAEITKNTWTLRVIRLMPIRFDHKVEKNWQLGCTLKEEDSFIGLFAILRPNLELSL